MAGHLDDSGQVLLTSAIIFALIIVVIALMLNNIIYATNVAYVGFMDGSKYEDLSIRQMTANEAAGAFQKYNGMDVIRSQYMNDYLKALNYLTNSKGKYIDLTDTYYTEPHLGLVTTQTQWNLVIVNKDSMVNYTLQTGSPDPSAPCPPSLLPDPEVSFEDAVYNITEGGAVTVTVNLSQVYDQAVVVNYATSPATATASVDYVHIAAGLVSFNPGEVSKTITITTLQDANYEAGFESFTVDFTGYTNAVAGSIVSATINIIDDDPAATPTPAPENYAMTVTITAVRATASPKKDVTITATVENTGLLPLTNIQFTLVSPTGKTVVTPFTSIATLNPGASGSMTCVIRTQNQNDLVNVLVKATANEIPAGVSSQQLTGI
ncbi:MAG: Calx-beta domain protein [Methanocella sp. PtaU1.Bin125]|nr:MAG: Calx-beta domain protein [Methanocella sp. PtaU1.Bin125]